MSLLFLSYISNLDVYNASTWKVTVNFVHLPQFWQIFYYLFRGKAMLKFTSIVSPALSIRF